MKIVKMSLVAALLAGTSAFAIDNVKTSGDVNVFYHTSDVQSVPDLLAGEADGSLFSKDSSAADAGLNLAISADLAKNDLVKVSGNAALTVLSTLGLENNFVSNVWGGAHTATAGTGATYAGSDHDELLGSALGGAKVENASWLSEAYITLGMQAVTKTTVMLGRMPLDTPLAFTETWSIEKNTFEGAALINQDIPDTTIVAAYVGNGNGNEALEGNDGIVAAGAIPLSTGYGLPDTGNLRSNVQTLGLANGGVVNANGQFGTFATDGAYALGVVNNSWKPLTAQFWYYDVLRTATAMWAQADLKMDGILVGAQYATVTVHDGDASGTMAAMVGYEMKDTVTVKAAFSQTSDKGALHGANVATSTNQSKLYTEAFWNRGYVTKTDTTAMKVSVESPVNGLFDLGFSYVSADVKAADSDMSEIALTAGKDFGPLNATLAVFNTDKEGSDKSNAVQAYLTLAF